MTISSREIHLVRRPVGALTADDFCIREASLDENVPGQVIVRNSHMSVDPYMRRRMDDLPSYIPPFRLNKAMSGSAVGEVVASTYPDISVGDWVSHERGWRDYAAVPGVQTTKINTTAAEASAYLGLLGLPGITAYVGVTHIAKLEEGDTIFVSGAAGAVGSIAGQIAKIKGARVIGSAGTEEKTTWLREELGFDAVINYRTSDLTEALRQAAPEGIDVYFDNVGYDHLDAALAAANNGARFAICGTIADYDTQSPPAGPRNLFQIVAKRLSIRGFIVADHYDLMGEFTTSMLGWYRDGALHYRETHRHGLDSAVEAMSEMLHGANVGKMIVAL